MGIAEVAAALRRCWRPPPKRVMNGDEAITERLMDTIIISKHAEATYQRRLKRQAVHTKRGNAASDQVAADLA